MPRPSEVVPIGLCNSYECLYRVDVLSFDFMKSGCGCQKSESRKSLHETVTFKLKWNVKKKRCDSSNLYGSRFQLIVALWPITADTDNQNEPIVTQKKKNSDSAWRQFPSRESLLQQNKINFKSREITPTVKFA